MRHFGPVGRAVELLVVAGTVAELLSFMLALLSVELVLLTAELVLAIELLVVVVAWLVEVVCCVVAVVVDVSGGVVVVTLERVPVKARSWLCGMPRWPLWTVTVWAAVNWPLSWKLTVSPSLQVCPASPQTCIEYDPPLVNAEPTFWLLSHGSCDLSVLRLLRPCTIWSSALLGLGVSKRVLLVACPRLRAVRGFSLKRPLYLPP